MTYFFSLENLLNIIACQFDFPMLYQSAQPIFINPYLSDPFKALAITNRSKVTMRHSSILVQNSFAISVHCNLFFISNLTNPKSV